MRAGCRAIAVLVVLAMLSGCQASSSSSQLQPETAPAAAIRAEEPAAAPAPPRPAEAQPTSAPPQRTAARVVLQPPPATPREVRWLYPAYVYEKGKQVWGYLDERGQFVIRPAYEAAKEFGPDGLAEVKLQGKAGLIDQNGVVVLAPAFSWITDPSEDGVRVAFGTDSQTVVDRNGKVLFTSTFLTSGFHEGLAPFTRTKSWPRLTGYMNEEGQVVLEPAYENAGDFKNGKALVKFPGGEYTLIDSDGRFERGLHYDYVGYLSQDFLFAQRSGKTGVLARDGSTVLPVAYDHVWSVDGEYAVVGTTSSLNGKDAIINLKGEYVVPPQYGAIRHIASGLYAAARPQEYYVNEQFLPKALMTAQGKLLTDFRYFSIAEAEAGLLVVSDYESTFFMDRTGKKVTSLPSLPAAGWLKVQGNLIRSSGDGILSYLTRDGKTVWQAPSSYTLPSGVRVHIRKYRPSRWSYVEYPEFEGLPDSRAQEAINRELAERFVGPSPAQAEPSAEEKVSPPRGTYDGEFKAEQMKNLLIVLKTGYSYPVGAAHGMPTRVHYHFDITTGKEYKLASLFKQGSQWQERLEALVAEQAASGKNQYLNDKTPPVSDNQLFAIQADGLLIYYRPYEIAAYAAGFVSFVITWESISDLIDTGEPFWKSFH